MSLQEYNGLSLDEKHNFIFAQPISSKGRFISFWKNDELTVSLWDCNSFYAEIHYSRVHKRITKIEGIELNDEKINIYIDYYLKHNNDEEYDLVEIA